MFQIWKIGEKFVGKIDGFIFTKEIIGSKHLLLKPPAIVIDKRVFEYVLDIRVKCMIIDDIENHIRYSIRKSDFNSKKFLIDRGHGEQYAVVLKEFSEEKY